MREKVTALQEKLSSLQEDSASQLGKRDMYWEDQADFETKRRKQAETENAILRKQVADQIAFAQTLQDLLKGSIELKFFRQQVPNVNVLNRDFKEISETTHRLTT